jgi:hypothetical protein
VLVLSVFNVLKTWLKKYFYDFEDNQELRDALLHFIRNDMMSTGYENPASQLEKLYKQQVCIMAVIDQAILGSSNHMLSSLCRWWLLLLSVLVERTKCAKRPSFQYAATDATASTQHDLHIGDRTASRGGGAAVDTVGIRTVSRHSAVGVPGPSVVQEGQGDQSTQHPQDDPTIQSSEPVDCYRNL